MADSSFSLEDLPELRRTGKSIGLCHGVFDVIHAGHINHFSDAKESVDILVVSVTADDFVMKPGRPIFSIEKRIAVLESLSMVDLVVASESATAVDTISLVKPDFFIKGVDYSNVGSDLALQAEREAVLAVGGQLLVTDSPKLSSTMILRNTISPITPEFRVWAQENLANSDLTELGEALDSIPRLIGCVRVVGDAIIDDFVFCNPIGLSGKEAKVTYRPLTRKRLPGGSMAIATNLSSLLTEKVHVVLESGLGQTEPEEISLPRNVKIRRSIDFAGRTVRKTKFIEQSSNERILSLYEDVEPRQAMSTEFRVEPCCQEPQLHFIADFGHGMLNAQRIADLICESRKSIVNLQLNSENRTFHDFEALRGATLISVNRRELSWFFGAEPEELPRDAEEIREKIGADNLLITLGSEGLVVAGDGQRYLIPAILDSVRDRIGAGDAAMVLAGLGIGLGLSLKLVGVLANMGGAVNTQMLATERGITKVDLQSVLEEISAAI